ncbi:MAG: rhamnogalacturonan acetylesterase [Gammaproteobacteria bacterium]|nr:rhamnogalacturonan acetylesterase [Gammaproteobacteria bacterium]MBU2428242.1 rhamnogalacturonan acetylesterase [Gammaproteobacteria bacterium]
MSQTVPKGTTTSMPAPRLHLVGDSTMADKVNLSYPERGWGQLLPEFMQQQLSIINHAANGRSTLRFLNEGRWQLLLTELKAGDYVLIQFGHNDQKKDDPGRYAAADSTFPTLLSRFIAEIRAKEAIPMLATPICRRSFNAQGQLENNLNEYAEATRNVASREKVTLFDLNAQSCADLSRFGLAASQAYFIQVPAGLYQQFPDGKIDNTHLNTQGASWIAQLFVRDLKKQQHPLAALVWRELL